MKYKRIVAYNPNTSVLFELENGKYALVGLNKPTDVMVSEYAGTFLKFGGFENPDTISEKEKEKAIKTLIAENEAKTI